MHRHIVKCQNPIPVDDKLSGDFKQNALISLKSDQGTNNMGSFRGVSKVSRTLQVSLNHQKTLPVLAV